jgi:hypothetical protein
VRTIQTRGTVSPEGKLTVALPPDIAPGEHQVVIVIDDVPSQDLAVISQHGGSLDWLDDEPDLYSDQDGEAIVSMR